MPGVVTPEGISVQNDAIDADCRNRCPYLALAYSATDGNVERDFEDLAMTCNTLRSRLAAYYSDIDCPTAADVVLRFAKGGSI